MNHSRNKRLTLTLFIVTLAMCLPIPWPAITKALSREISNSTTTRPAQASFLQFVEHRIEQDCLGCPTGGDTDILTTANADLDFTYPIDGQGTILIPNGKLSLSFPSTLQDGVTSPVAATISATGTRRVFGNPGSATQIVDVVINRHPAAEQIGFHQDVRKVSCLPAPKRFLQPAPLNGGDQFTPGLNPFTVTAGCNLKIPELFQDFEGSAIIVISTIDLVIGSTSGPVDTFNYFGRYMRITVRTKYQPLSCPGFSADAIAQTPGQGCPATKLNVDGGPQIEAGKSTEIKIEARKTDNSLDTNFDGIVQASLDATSTPKIGCLRLNDTGPCTSSVSVQMQNGRPIASNKVFLRTPETELTPESVLKPNDPPLEGKAVIKAQAGANVFATGEVQIKSPLDLSVEKIEAQQGVIQGSGDTWIGERDMFIRVYLKANRSGAGAFVNYSRIEGITAALLVKDASGTEIPSSPFKLSEGSVNNAVNTPNAPFIFYPALGPQSDGADTLNYLLNGTFEKQLNLEVKLDPIFPDRNPDNNSASFGPMNFRNSRTLSFLATKLRIIDPTNKTEFPTQAGIDKEIEFLKAAWPIAGRALQFVERDDEAQTTVPLAGNDPLTLRTRLWRIPFWISSLRGIRYVYWVDSNYFSRVRSRDVVKSVGDAGSGGVTDEVFKYSVVDTERCLATPNRCGILAHELGHQFGLKDSYNNQTEVRGSPVEDGNFSWIHHEFAPGRLNVDRPAFTYIDFMGNGGRRDELYRTWTNVFNTTHLKSRVLYPVGVAQLQSLQARAASPYVIVQGEVKKSGISIIENCFTLSLTGPENDVVPGDYVVETMDANSTVLSSLSFAPGFQRTHESSERDEAPFEFALPFSSATRRIRLRHGTSVLATQAVSPGIPTAQFTSNFAGQTLTGTQEVTWTGSDPDGDPVTYDLYYSPDGELRMPLTETTTTSFSWKTGTFPSGPSPRLTLVASDGVNSRVVDSAPFTIPNRPPRITILSPVNQHQFKTGDPVVLSATFYDPEGETAEPPAIQWSSSLKGALGAGAQLTISNLQAGTHQISATGIDAKGLPGSSSVTVTVRSDNFSSITATPEDLDFGTVPIGVARDIRLVVRNNGNVSLTLNSMVSNDPRFSVPQSQGPVILGARSLEEFVVRFTPSTAEPRNATLTLTSTAANQSVLQIPMHGTGTGASAGMVASVSAATFNSSSLARGSIVAAFGVKLATATAIGATVPLPSELAGTSVLISDAEGDQILAPLFFVSEGQINYLIPAHASEGLATVSVRNGNGEISLGTVRIVAVSPGLFTANSDGKGVPSGYTIRVRADNSQTSEPIAQFDQTQAKFLPAPIDFGPQSDQLVLVLFGTGFRYRSALSAVSCVIGGTAADVSYAGIQGAFVGLDQLNITLPRSLGNRGELDAIVTVDGLSNTVKLRFGTQAPTCEYSILPTAQNFPPNGGIGFVNVNTQPDCAWTAMSNAPWVAVTGGSPGNGAGTLNYFVAPNTTANSRNGTITIAGRTFIITQAAPATPVTVIAHRTSGGPIPDACAPPTLKTAFLTTDPIVYQWTLVNGSHVGDQVRWEFSAINGGFAQTAQLIVQTEGNICFWSGLNIAGTPVAQNPGNWQVRVFYNNVLVFTDNFSVSAP